MSTDTIETRVARGAALMDAKRPGWDGRIDIKNLDLVSPCGCILGQEFDTPFLEGYYVGLDELLNGSTALAIHYGFTTEDGGDEWDDLEKEWRRVILARCEVRDA